MDLAVAQKRLEKVKPNQLVQLVIKNPSEEARDSFLEQMANGLSSSYRFLDEFLCKHMGEGECYVTGYLVEYNGEGLRISPCLHQNNGKSALGYGAEFPYGLFDDLQVLRTRRNGFF